jgi:hypothetical protein
MVYNPRCSPANPAISTSRADLSRPAQAKEVLDEMRSDKVNEGRYSSVFNNCHVFVQRLKMRILNTTGGPDSSNGQRMSHSSLSSGRSAVCSPYTSYFDLVDEIVIMTNVLKTWNAHLVPPKATNSIDASDKLLIHFP